MSSAAGRTFAGRRRSGRSRSCPRARSAPVRGGSRRSRPARPTRSCTAACVKPTSCAASSSACEGGAQSRGPTPQPTSRSSILGRQRRARRGEGAQGRRPSRPFRPHPPAGARRRASSSARCDDGRAYLVVNLDESLVGRGLDAAVLIRDLGRHIGGGGGGRPTLAEAGGKNPAFARRSGSRQASDRRRAQVKVLALDFGRARPASPSRTRAADRAAARASSSGRRPTPACASCAARSASTRPSGSSSACR